MFSKFLSDKCLFLCSLLFKNRNFEKLLTFFVSVSRDKKIWGNERIYFLENLGPKSFLSLIYIFFLGSFGEKRRRHYLRMIIINHNSIIENFEHFFSGLIRSTQTHFFLKWFLNIFMNYIQFKRGLQQSYLKFICKVEKILKGTLDSTPSPSPSGKIQIMGRKVCLSCNGKLSRK